MSMDKEMLQEVIRTLHDNIIHGDEGLLSCELEAEEAEDKEISTLLLNAVDCIERAMRRLRKEVPCEQ